MSYRDNIKRLPESLFKTEPGSIFSRLWNLFADELDEIAVVLDAMLLMRDIGSSEGRQLDNLGQILKLTRNYLNDADYRMMMQIAKILLRAHGTIPLLNEVFSAMFPDRFLSINPMVNGSDTRRYDGAWAYDGSYYWDGIPATTAGFEIVMTEHRYVDPQLQKLADLVRIIKAAGVRAEVVKGGYQ